MTNNQNDFAAHFYLGLVFDEKNKYEKAIAHYKKTLELNPKAENAYNNLALVYLKTKDYQKAYDILIKAIKLGHPKKKQMAKLARDIEGKLDKADYSFSVG